MEAYATVLLIMIPALYLLIIVEAVYAYAKGNFNFRTMDTISSLSAGLTNTLKEVMGLTILIVGYDYLVQHFALVHRETTWVTYVLSFIALDFASYWYHRLAHQINIFWNRHVIHHSGEDFNLPTAMRQSISKFVNISVFFLLPAALLGLPPMIIAIVTPVHFFAQFWYHTTHIGKLGWLEYIIVTPSQHRVHHAINQIYLDRNLSAVFCIWDRLFGTFQEELDEEPCVYGVTRQVYTWNPIRINLNHLWLLITDAWRTDNWLDKLTLWFKPTGWRPTDVIEAYPVTSTTPETFVKYDTAASSSLKIWSWVQFLASLGMTLHLLYKIAAIDKTSVFIYGFFLFLVVYCFTTLMDRDQNAIWMEALKSAIGLGIIFVTGDWFLIDTILAGGTVLVGAYFVLSALIVAYFVVYEIGWNKEEREEQIGIYS